MKNDAVEKYREFHRLEPNEVGAFDRDFVIPKAVRVMGAARAVYYRSRKVDPETLKRPRRPVNYVHQHEDGVMAYATIGGPLDLPDSDVVSVPGWLVEVDHLVLLGECLGLIFEDDQGEIEVGVDDPLPMLYTIPSGKALLVVEGKHRVVALVWGGDLGVEGRGIVG